jgi:ssDNA-binding Zn-finger/Zn-ribbon topoisomerase 1
VDPTGEAVGDFAMKHVCPKCGSDMTIRFIDRIEHWVCESGHQMKRFKQRFTTLPLGERGKGERGAFPLV